MIWIYYFIIAYLLWGLGLAGLLYTHPSRSIERRRWSVDVQIQMSEWRPFAWVGLYVVSSALLVRSWNILWLANNWLGVYLEIIFTALFLSIMSLYLLPRIENFSLSKIGWKEGLPTNEQLSEIILAIALIFFVFIVPSYMLEFDSLPSSIGFFPLDITIANIMIGSTSALAEEVVYRGFLLTYLDRTDPLEFQNNLIQAGLFTVLHFAYLSEFSLLVLNSPQLLIFTLEAFIAGLVFGWLKNRHKNLASPTIVHVAINIIGVILR